MLILSDLIVPDNTIDVGEITGRVHSVHGSVIQAFLPKCRISELCQVFRSKNSPLLAQVVSFQGDLATLAPFDVPDGISPMARVCTLKHSARIDISQSMLGTVVNCLGKPLLHSRPLKGAVHHRPIDSSAPDPLSRPPVSVQFSTGIRSLDALMPVGFGQRMAVLAGPGSGKSTLLGMIANHSNADLNVIALVGERGREVREFIELTLSPDTLKKTVIVVATSDESAIRRMLAAQTATSIAEHFRDQGHNVLLLVDSLTRKCRAIREVGLAAGEIPVRQGYTASVYTQLPKLIERAGTSERGSITAFFTLLSSCDLQDDPIAEEVLSLTDGHILLSEKLNQQGILPAIDPGKSLSRLASRFRDPLLHRRIQRLSHLISRLLNEKELLIFGNKPDSELQTALARETQIFNFLQQGPERGFSHVQSMAAVTELLDSFDTRQCDPD